MRAKRKQQYRRAGLAILPPGKLAGFDHSNPKFKFSTTLINTRLVASMYAANASIQCEGPTSITLSQD